MRGLLGWPTVHENRKNPFLPLVTVSTAENKMPRRNLTIGQGGRRGNYCTEDWLFNGHMFYAPNHLTSWHMSLALMTLLTYSTEHAMCREVTVASAMCLNASNSQSTSSVVATADSHSLRLNDSPIIYLQDGAREERRGEEEGPAHAPRLSLSPSLSLCCCPSPSLML